MSTQIRLHETSETRRFFEKTHTSATSSCGIKDMFSALSTLITTVKAVNLSFFKLDTYTDTFLTIWLCVFTWKVSNSVHYILFDKNLRSVRTNVSKIKDSSCENASTHAKPTLKPSTHKSQSAQTAIIASRNQLSHERH